MNDNKEKLVVPSFERCPKCGHYNCICSIKREAQSQSVNKQQEEIKALNSLSGILKKFDEPTILWMLKTLSKSYLISQPQQSNPTNTEEHKAPCPLCGNIVPKTYDHWGKHVGYHCNECGDLDVKKLQSVNTEEQLKWKDAVLNPPKESGRYWCYVTEYNDLGIAHYQWNCAYSAEENRWSDNGLAAGDRVTHWMPLAEQPKVQQSDSEQLKSLEKEAEEKYPLPNSYVGRRIAELQQAAYIAGAQRTEGIFKPEHIIQLTKQEYYSLKQELKEKELQLQVQETVNDEVCKKYKEQAEQIQTLKEELKHEQLKIEAIEGHVDALWEENAQLKGKVAEAFDAGMARMKFKKSDWSNWNGEVPPTKAEYLKTITDKIENNG